MKRGGRRPLTRPPASGRRTVTGRLEDLGDDVLGGDEVDIVAAPPLQLQHQPGEPAGVGRPVRVQWSRQEEHGLDPKGPAQLLELRAAVDADGGVAAGGAGVAADRHGQPPQHSAAGAGRGGIKQSPGRATGLIYQNVDPPYALPNLHLRRLGPIEGSEAGVR